jgi:hypothetical protein
MTPSIPILVLRSLLAAAASYIPTCQAAADTAPLPVEPCQSRQTAQWGLCRSDGSNAPPVVAQNFDFIGAGSDLFPARLTPDGPAGYIDVKGRWTIQPQYRQAQPFSDGLAVVSDGKRSAAIDRHGALVVPWFDGLLYPFSQGLGCFVPGGLIELGPLGKLRKNLFGRSGDDPYPAAWWRIEGRAGFMDTAGRVVIPPRFEPKLNFLLAGCGFGSAGYAAMREKGHEGLIDRTGRWAVQPEYSYLGLAFSGNRKVVAVIADRVVEQGYFLNTVERVDGFMGPDGMVRWRETGPPREQVVAGGLMRSLMNALLFPRWQEDLLNQEPSSAILKAWLGSLLTAFTAGIALLGGPGARRRPMAWRCFSAVLAGFAALAMAFLLGALSPYFTVVIVMFAAVGVVRLFRTGRRAPA